MLLRLTIRDFVLVDTLELEFASGFGTLTGETGAGKSILIDALAFVLGERADAGLVRSGAERAEVSAEFDLAQLPDVEGKLVALDIAVDRELLLRRVLDANGRSRAYLNGTPVPLSQLREVTDLLIDIHGQHAHQSLLRPDAQRQILDGYGGHEPALSEVGSLWRRWRMLHERWRGALSGGEAAAREREQLQWEISEFEALAFTVDEWTSLNEEQARLAHASALVEGAQFALQGLAEADGSCASQLAAVTSRLETLTVYDSRLDETVELVRSAVAEISEAAASLRRYADRVDLDPSRLGEVDRRIQVILDLARKFRIKPEALPDALFERRQRLDELGQSLDPAALEAEAVAAHQAFFEAAKVLSEARAKTAEALSALVSERMHELALASGRFEIALLPLDEGSATGLERVEFRVGGLAGNEARPLAKVASGGELSRISLALQVVASQAAQVPTLVFDEVDVGIGGGVAEVVGRMLRELGRQRQVLCVTHLPQVAAQADWQWRVSKLREAKGFLSQVEVLDAAARVEEIARMLGGVEITALTRQHAREMLGTR